jgi:excisionase family DNA binding protein
MNNPKLYTVKEAAKIVGVSTNTLYKYLDEDRIHAARGSAIQGRFRIPESALEEFLGVKLSEPEITESVGADPRVRPIVPNVSDGQTLQDIDVPNVSRVTVSPTRAKLPLKLARILLVFALLAVLLDLFISKSVSVVGVISRIFFLAVMLLLSYQEGGFRRS